MAAPQQIINIVSVDFKSRDGLDARVRVIDIICYNCKTLMSQSMYIFKPSRPDLTVVFYGLFTTRIHIKITLAYTIQGVSKIAFSPFMGRTH